MQVIATAFSGTRLVGLCPLELSFPFVPNQEMHCHLGLTNNTNTLICCMLTPEVPDKYHWKGFEGYLQPMQTTAVTLYRKAEEERMRKEKGEDGGHQDDDVQSFEKFREVGRSGM